MIIFYTNRDLSQKLGINLAKWKRWSREFLPPDPLGGLRSGYARQYNLGSAFKVFLGGHLISDLKYTVPEVKKILEDLFDWLTENGFYFDVQESLPAGTDMTTPVKAYQIFINKLESSSDNEINFTYTIRGILSNESIKHIDCIIREERFIECTIPATKEAPLLYSSDRVRLLNISYKRKQFLTALKLIENNIG